MYITYTETKLGSEIHVFLSNVDFSIIAKIICNRKDHLMAVICRYNTDLLIIFGCCFA